MRSRGVLVIIMLIVLHSVAAALSDDEQLLINPSAESGLVGWKMMYGNTWGVRGHDPDPKQENGYQYFFAGTDGATELHQTVDVSALAPTIDANRQVFEFSGWVSSYPQTYPTPNDISEIFVDYLNAAGTPLWTYHVSNKIAQWRLVSNTRLAPPRTRRIRVRLRATRQSYSGSNDGYFDGLSLTTHECDCPACQQCNTNGICVANSTLNGKSCNQFPQNQVVRPENSAGVPVDIMIDQSCNEGICQDGHCNLISDRWGITAIVQAAEGAVETIFAPPFGYCLQEPLRQRVQQNLPGGFTVECFNGPYCSQAFGINTANPTCGCTSPSEPGRIVLNNLSLADCAKHVTGYVGPTPPSAEENFERTIFHEIVHDKGGVEHTYNPYTDISWACDKACYGCATGVSPADFEKIDPARCQ
jgi:hypothetical protein